MTTVCVDMTTIYRDMTTVKVDMTTVKVDMINLWLDVQWSFKVSLKSRGISEPYNVPILCQTPTVSTHNNTFGSTYNRPIVQPTLYSLKILILEFFRSYLKSQIKLFLIPTPDRE
jgi:hypothetical protein